MKLPTGKQRSRGQVSKTGLVCRDSIRKWMPCQSPAALGSLWLTGHTLATGVSGKRLTFSHWFWTHLPSSRQKQILRTYWASLHRWAWPYVPHTWPGTTDVAGKGTHTTRSVTCECPALTPDWTTRFSRSPRSSSVSSIGRLWVWQSHECEGRFWTTLHLMRSWEPHLDWDVGGCLSCLINQENCPIMAF